MAPAASFFFVPVAFLELSKHSVSKFFINFGILKVGDEAGADCDTIIAVESRAFVR